MFFDVNTSCMDSEKITERVRQFIEWFSSDYRWFESLTGVGASKWRDLERGKTKAVTAQMIEGLCQAWPEFAYWFVTGERQSARGQHTPLDYFQWEYEKPGVFSPSFAVARLPNGTLRSTLIYPEARSAEEHELRTVEYQLWASALLNYGDAARLAPVFWKEFVRPLKSGKTLSFTPRDLKAWINKHPAGHDQVGT